MIKHNLPSILNASILCIVVFPWTLQCSGVPGNTKMPQECVEKSSTSKYSLTSNNRGFAFSYSLDSVTWWRNEISEVSLQSKSNAALNGEKFLRRYYGRQGVIHDVSPTLREVKYDMFDDRFYLTSIWMIDQNAGSSGPTSDVILLHKQDGELLVPTVRMVFGVGISRPSKTERWLALLEVSNGEVDDRDANFSELVEWSRFSEIDQLIQNKSSLIGSLAPYDLQLHSVDKAMVGNRLFWVVWYSGGSAGQDIYTSFQWSRYLATDPEQNSEDGAIVPIVVGLDGVPVSFKVVGESEFSISF